MHWLAEVRTVFWSLVSWREFTVPSLVPEGVQGNGAGAVSVCPVKLGHPGREVLSATWGWSGSLILSPPPCDIMERQVHSRPQA